MKTGKFLLTLLSAASLLASCDIFSTDVDFGEADIQVNPETLTFSQTVSSQTVTILSTRPWQAEFSESWIAVEPAKGEPSLSEQEVTITVLENNSVERTAKIVFNAGIVRTSLTLTQPGDGSQGNGTAESPYTVNAAMEIISGMNSSESKTVYVKGKVSKLGEFGESYGNYTYYISDTDSTGTNLEVYRGYGLNKAKFTSADDLKLGDEVVVYGDVVNFKGNTPEFTSGSQLVYLNGQTAPIVEETPGTPEGAGTAESPFNVAAAIAKCQEIGTTASTDKYYVKGIVTGSNGIDASWGNATFYIKDANATATFYIYRCYSFDGAQFTSTDVFKDGDEVVVCGPLVNYQGNTPEMTTGGSLITVNGAGAPEPVVGPAEGSGTAESPFNVSAAIAKAKPIRTAFQATKLAIGAFIIPYMFVFNPQMLMIDASVGNVLWIMVTALIGMFGISSGLEGYSLRKASVIERVLFIVGGLLCIIPENRTDIVGLVIIAALIAFQLVLNARKKPQTA